MNKNGFTIIEGLLAIIAVTLVGFAGFYVYNAKQEDKNKNTINTSATTKTSEKQDKIEYKEFKNLGIKIKLDDQAKQFAYEENEYGQTVSSTTLKKLGEDACGKTSGINGAFATLSKLDGKYNTEEGITELIKQFPSFAITVSYPSGGLVCEGTEASQQAFTDKSEELRATIKQIFQNSEQL